ncbi:transposase [Trichonephila clavipes]|nr:transposase [Trichonephila clavipes]
MLLYVERNSASLLHLVVLFMMHHLYSYRFKRKWNNGSRVDTPGYSKRFCTVGADRCCTENKLTSLFWILEVAVGSSVVKKWPRSTIEREGLRIRCTAASHLTASAAEIRAAIGTRVIQRTVRNRCQVIYSQFGLAIHQNDHQARRRFVEWAQNEIAVVPDFHKRILFSDEAHIWLNGYANKQNCRIWSEANPQVYVETPLHPEKLTVWCALLSGGIIGPYFFKNDEGHNVTVNGDRYRAMITNFFIPELNNRDAQELWFQQDGATCHTACGTIDLLKDTFGDRLISRFGPVNWPPKSCDLTPLDYLL